MKTVLTFLCLLIIVFSIQDCKCDCPKSCLHSRCITIHLNVTICKGCVDGKKGISCGLNCPENCTRCERYRGKCLGPCKDPMKYGDFCEKTCPEHCSDGCNSSGVCYNCSPGYKGADCNITCSAACKKCERYGDKCVGPCMNPMQYGDFCNKTCPHHCTDGCNSSGLCNNCTAGYRGEMCNIPCSSTCLHCERYGGRCVGECPHPEYYGDLCHKTCPETCVDGCDRDTGSCRECPVGHQGPQCAPIDADDKDPSVFHIGTARITMITVAAVTFVITIVYTSVYCRRMHRRKLRNYRVRDGVGQAKKQRKKKRQSSWGIDNVLYEPSNGVTFQSRVRICRELAKDNTEQQLRQEFKTLPRPNVQPYHCGELAENFLKNRYKDIIPYDGSRVCLDVEEDGESDYINASFIDGYRQKSQYIAAQGPTRSLVVDFWRMVWQCDVIKIVMLTNIIEGTKFKCAQYWPDCGVDCVTYGNISVQCTEEKVFEHYIIRTLEVWRANCGSRTVHQFHCTSWPVQGVPGEVDWLLDFYKVVKNTDTGEQGPTLVHCSAGVGRTGTFIALIHLVEQARHEGRACVYMCVHDMRFQRMKMVHTEDQYVFLTRVLTAALQTRGILPDNTTPIWLQCHRCWETKRRRPVVNGVHMVYSQLERNQSSSYTNV